MATPNYGYTIPVSTDIVNLLTQCYPNFSLIDTDLKAVSDAAVTVAVETKVGTVHNIVRSDTDRNIIRFVATSNYVAGDTFTVDGNAVTATTPAGTSIPAGGFVINSSVFAILDGAKLTVFVGGGASDASDINYDNSDSGLTATDVQDAIDEIVNGIETLADASLLHAEGTITAGNTSVTISDANITANSYIDIYFWNRPDVTYSNVTVSTGSVTVTIPAADAADIDVSVRIANLS